MRHLKKPAHRMFVLSAMIVVTAGLVVWLALRQPWLGVTFTRSESGETVQISAVAQRRGDIPPGAIAQRLVAANGTQVDLRPMDIIEEPDLYDTYEEMDTFFSRQAILAAVLHSGEVRLQWQAEGSQGETVMMPGQRPLGDLPPVFWFQLVAGFLCLLIAGWVYLLRAQDWGARMFALTGLAFPFATSSAAIYSTRELALPENLFRLLSHLNHFGSTVFGMALAALFACYPRLLLRPVYLLGIPAFFGIWYLADLLRWVPDSNWGFRLPLIVELLLAMTFAFIQWHKSRGQPLERAALRWFTLATLLGCSLFIVTVVLQSTLKLPPLVSQGYAFGFFLIMYVGIALGLGRYRLFDLDEWSYRILLWVAGATAVISLDALLILSGIEQTLSLGGSLLIVGWLYFPFRQWLWQRMVGRHAAQTEKLPTQLSGLAFAPDMEAREAHWDGLLRDTFDPLEIIRKGSGHSTATLCEEGLALSLPPSGGMQPRILRFAAGGGRLFSTRDVRFADTLCHLVEQVMSGRKGYEQGVRQERQRLARDLHDNIGAQLLRLIHHLRGSPEASLARDAMKDLRATIAAIDSAPAPLLEALADWRAEISARCMATGVELRWNQSELPPVNLPARTRAALGAVLREAVSNALRHAAPGTIHLRVLLNEGQLELVVGNDGTISPTADWQEGYGLRNMRGRLNDVGGGMTFTLQAGELRLHLSVPLT